MMQLSLTFYKQISRIRIPFSMAEYANIDIIARRLQILIYTVYTIENELVWIGTERMQMFESGLTLIRRCSSNSCSLLILVLGEKKDATMEETTGITIARGTKHCVLCCSLESNRGEDSFVKLKRTIQQRVLFPLVSGPMLYRPTYRFQCARSA